MKDEVVRLADIPLVIRLSGMPAMARGSRIKLDIIGWDELDLTLEARFLELIAAPDSVNAAEAEQAEAEEAQAEEALAEEAELADTVNSSLPDLEAEQDLVDLDAESELTDQLQVPLENSALIEALPPSAMH